MATLEGGLAHDVSILPGIGRHLGSQPGAVSITIMPATARAVGKYSMGVGELQLVGVVAFHEHRKHLAAEQARQRVDVDEEVGTRRRALALNICVNGGPTRLMSRIPTAAKINQDVSPQAVLLERERALPC